VAAGPIIALMLVPSLAGPHGPGSLAKMPDAASAPRPHLVQQYDPPSLPPEIMVPERRTYGRQPAPPPISIAPFDPVPLEPPQAEPGPLPVPAVPEQPNPLIAWCKVEANAKLPMCRNVGGPKVQR
jgi:hypothetical protein